MPSAPPSAVSRSRSSATSRMGRWSSTCVASTTRPGSRHSSRSSGSTSAARRLRMFRRKAPPPEAAPQAPGTAPRADDTAPRMVAAAAAAAHGDYTGALAVWVELAHTGVARAQAEIGNCFVHALGVERNPELAENWLTLAAKAGDAVGQRLLANFHFNGENGSPDRPIAEEWYARAARQGDAEAQDILSWMLTDSDHRQPDYDRSMQLALKAAEQGNAASMTLIRLLYTTAKVVEGTVR